LDGSSRKADDPLALATERLLFQPYPKRFWDKLDINDQDDIGLTNLLMTYDDRQEGRDLNAREAVSVPVVFGS
ncbi:hypothetical protein T08_13957, partial [Trichinella sp. T8]